MVKGILIRQQIEQHRDSGDLPEQLASAALRASDRPRRRTAEQRDEIAPSQ
jgi:hypothetical protein